MEAAPADLADCVVHVTRAGVGHGTESVLRILTHTYVIRIAVPGLRDQLEMTVETESGRRKLVMVGDNPEAVKRLFRELHVPPSGIRPFPTVNGPRDNVVATIRELHSRWSGVLALAKKYDVALSWVIDDCEESWSKAGHRSLRGPPCYCCGKRIRHAPASSGVPSCALSASDKRALLGFVEWWLDLALSQGYYVLICDVFAFDFWPPLLAEAAAWEVYTIAALVRESVQ